MELIEPATTADHVSLADVWEASARATHHFVANHDWPIFRKGLLQAFQQPALQLYMIRQKERIIAFIGVEYQKVEMLFVHPDFFRKGFGQSLLRFAIRELGATELDVSEQNTRAVAFYLRQGFQVISRSETDGMGKPYPALHLRFA